MKKISSFFLIFILLILPLPISRKKAGYPVNETVAVAAKSASRFCHSRRRGRDSAKAIYRRKEKKNIAPNSKKLF